MVNVGTYSSNKNQLQCLEVFCKAKLNDYKLVLIGKPENKYYKKLLKKKSQFEKKYGIKNVEIKVNVDRELISIAQMIKFPIQFLEIKKQINLNEIINKIEVNTINANENIQNYARHLIKHLEKLQKDQDLFERKNYMIISSFNDRKTAEVELKEFYQLLKYHLLNTKVSIRLLSDKEILELIYEQFHKNNKNKVSEIEENGGFELYVTSKEREKDKTV